MTKATGLASLRTLTTRAGKVLLEPFEMSEWNAEAPPCPRDTTSRNCRHKQKIFCFV